MRYWALAAVTSTWACSGGSHGMPDAGPCWPLKGEPGGSVELGTGELMFQPMPTTLMVIRNASQSDPYLDINARIHGLPPGNPQDFFDPTNPKTKINATVPDLGWMLGIDCPASIGYMASGTPDYFDMLHSLRIGFGANPVQMADGKTAHITIDVVGSNGLIAHDEKDVTLSVPTTVE